MTYGPPPGNPPGQPSGGYGPPPPGGQPGGYGPPPGGGYGQPAQQGQYGPPPGGQYGAPYGGGQYGQQRKSGFDLAAVNPLDWAAIGLAIIAFIFSFLSFYTAKVSFSGQSQSAHENAWHGFFGWFAVLLALVAAALVALALFAPHVDLPVPTRLVAGGVYVLSVIFIVIAIFVTPGKADAGAVPSGVKVDYGRGYGFWITLIAIVVGAVVTFLRFQQTGGSLAALTGNRAGSGSGDFGQPSYGGSPQGYGAAQQQGYGAAQQHGAPQGPQHGGPGAPGQSGYGAPQGYPQQTPQHQAPQHQPPQAPQQPQYQPPAPPQHQPPPSYQPPQQPGYQPPQQPGQQPGYQPPQQPGQQPGYQPPAQQPPQGPPPGYQPPPSEDRPQP